MRSRSLPLMLIAAILVGGSYVRLSGLGAANFNGDELDHYYAALALRGGQGPVLPSGNTYSRGLDMTRLVSWSIPLSNDPELAARLPSAAFGILALLLLAVCAWMMAGPWPAVWAVFLLAIYPEAIVQSRTTRFYTYQLCWGILALLTGWKAIKNAGTRETPTRAETARAWGWAALTVVFFALALRAQLTTFSVALAACACVVIAAIADVRSRGLAAWRRSFPIQAFVLGAVLALSVVILRPDTIRLYALISQRTPAWSGVGNPLSYYYSLSNFFPLITGLLPLIFVVAFVRNSRLCAYLAVWFFVPLFLHSAVFPWKGDRYVLLAMPALFIVTGMAASSAWGSLQAWLTGVLSTVGPGASHTQYAHRLATVAVSLIACFAVVTQHGFNEARRIPPNFKPIDWEAAQRLIATAQADRSFPLGTSIALPALFYWDRADFVVGTDFLEAPGEEHQLVLNPQGTPDWYGGVPTLTTPDLIRERFGSAGGVIVGIDTDRWRFNNVDADLKRVLSRDAVELCAGRCGDLLLFEWSFEPTDAPGDAAGPLRPSP